MSEQEYTEARASTLTAFYTPAPIIRAIGSAFRTIGFGDRKRPDALLEPGCGVGNFPRAMSGSYRYTGIETDATSAEIASILLPQADIINAGMEDCAIPAGSWAAAAGNVPYSQDITIPYGPSGRRLPIHDWFILSTLDALSPGGVAMLLTSRYTLDKTDATTRAHIAARADLLTAVRLPSETFRRQAGTDVTSDLLVLRRRDTDEPRDEDPTWTATVPFEGQPVNAWYAEHPENVIGSMHVVSGPHGPMISVDSGMDAARIAEQLDHRLAADLARHGDLHARLGRPKGTPQAAVIPTDRKSCEYFADRAGHVWYGDRMSVHLVHSRTAKGGDARIVDMIGLRDQARRLIDMELDPSNGDAAIAQAIRELDLRYERFAARWGRLADPANRRAWNPEDKDPSLAQLYALETTDAKGRFAAKAAILSTRVATPVPPTPTHVDDPAEALTISLNTKGRVDMAFIAGLTGEDEETTAARLGDAVVNDPTTGEWLTDDDYLSGDVAAKFVQVDALIRRYEDPSAGEIAWLDHESLTDAWDEPLPDEARDAFSRYLASGAWTSLTDPVHAAAYVSPDAWGDTIEQQYGRQHEWAPAMLSNLIDDMKPGSRPVRRRTDANGRQTTETDKTWSSLARGLFDERYDTTPGDVGERALHKAVIADPAVLDQETLAELLSKSLPWRFQASHPLVQLTNPSHWDKSTYYANLDDPMGLAGELRADPTISGYMFACAVKKTRATRDGLEDYRRRRAGFLESHAASANTPEALEHVAALRRLRERLAERLPAPLDHTSIAVGLGSAWIPAHVIHDFITETIIGDSYFTDAQLRNLRVSHDETTGTWQVKAPGLSGGLLPSVVDKYSTTDRSPYQLIEDALNGSTVMVTRPDPSDPEGKRRVKDPAATAAAWDKMHNLQQDFEEWVWNDPARAKELTDLYNRRFNNIAPRDYDGSRLTLPGMSSDITLRPHQKDAVARVLRSGEGSLIAHVVGAGKTYTIITACHEAVRLGKATKPMVAVPNHLTEQWASDWQRLYPGSRILAMDTHDMSSADNVRRFWNTARNGDWDAIIVGHSRFSGLQVAPEIRKRYYTARMEEMTESIAAAKEQGNDFTVKQLEKQKSRITTRLDRLRGEEGLEGVTFDKLGVDMLAVDEAHMFKNLAVATSMNVAGMTVAASAKCEDLLDKCQWLRDTGHASNIVFATGTPVSNTMAELYNMERYLAPKLLESQHVTAFSSWANTFGRITENIETRPEGGFQIKQRFGRFQNIPELMNAYHTFADIKTGDDLDLEVPDCKSVTVAVKPTPEQLEEIERLAERAKAVRDRKVEPDVDNMLAITGDGRKIALDPKLLAPDDPDRAPLEGGKVQACADNIIRIIHERETDPDPARRKAAQLVFCDTSTPASGRWNIQQDLKDRLVAAGIPAERVAFATDAGNNPTKRDQLFEKVRKADIQVLIGSTATLGTGTNVQDRLIAIHDLDCPWRPADLEQRLGRIQRQGNTFDHVTDYRYVTEKTFDGYLYQTIERKQRFISQVFTSENPAREADDLDETVLSYAEIKAIATGDPQAVERMNLEIQFGKLRLLKKAHTDQHAELGWRIRHQLEPGRDLALERSTRLEDDHQAFLAARDEGGATRLDDGTIIKDRKDLAYVITKLARQVRPGQEATIGEYKGLGIRVKCRGTVLSGQPVTMRYIGLAAKHDHWYDKQIPAAVDGPHTVVTQLDRLINTDTEGNEQARQAYEQAEKALAQAYESYNRPWEEQAEYDRLAKELEKSNKKIRQGTTSRTDEPEPDGHIATTSQAPETNGSNLPEPDPVGIRADGPDSGSAALSLVG